VQSDPIGLERDINTYSYVNLNPLTSIDLFGLTTVYRGPNNSFSGRPPSGQMCSQAIWIGGYIVGWGPCNPAKMPPQSQSAAACPTGNQSGDPTGNGDPQFPPPPPKYTASYAGNQWHWDMDPPELKDYAWCLANVALDLASTEPFEQYIEGQARKRAMKNSVFVLKTAGWWGKFEHAGAVGSCFGNPRSGIVR
jgi:hypothetical protein